MFTLFVLLYFKPVLYHNVVYWINTERLEQYPSMQQRNQYNTAHSNRYSCNGSLNTGTMYRTLCSVKRLNLVLVLTILEHVKVNSNEIRSKNL